ncbi:uncharacterized protein [Lepeophtheirus salmonis]|uniref:uncharacterized protein isoform X2 n=1 Tax=Lepeophtheirus salmonis TaxID=72036 RepID=UPI001AE88013|nr:uncharacterized protein PF11_0207-like isoform X2 [Lepeophtheirus salmonis]
MKHIIYLTIIVLCALQIIQQTTGCYSLCPLVVRKARNTRGRAGPEGTVVEDAIYNPTNYGSTPEEIQSTSEKEEENEDRDSMQGSLPDILAEIGSLDGDLNSNVSIDIPILHYSFDCESINSNDPLIKNRELCLTPASNLYKLINVTVGDIRSFDNSSEASDIDQSNTGITTHSVELNNSFISGNDEEYSTNVPNTSKSLEGLKYELEVEKSLIKENEHNQIVTPSKGPKNVIDKPKVSIVISKDNKENLKTTTEVESKHHLDIDETVEKVDNTINKEIQTSFSNNLYENVHSSQGQEAKEDEIIEKEELLKDDKNGNKIEILRPLDNNNDMQSNVERYTTNGSQIDLNLTQTESPSKVMTNKSYLNFSTNIDTDNASSNHESEYQNNKSKMHDQIDIDEESEEFIKTSDSCGRNNNLEYLNRDGMMESLINDSDELHHKITLITSEYDDIQSRDSISNESESERNKKEIKIPFTIIQSTDEQYFANKDKPIDSEKLTENEKVDVTVVEVRKESKEDDEKSSLNNQSQYIRQIAKQKNKKDDLSSREVRFLELEQEDISFTKRNIRDVKKKSELEMDKSNKDYSTHITMGNNDSSEASSKLIKSKPHLIDKKTYKNESTKESITKLNKKYIPSSKKQNPLTHDTSSVETSHLEESGSEVYMDNDNRQDRTDFAKNYEENSKIRNHTNGTFGNKTEKDNITTTSNNEVGIVSSQNIESIENDRDLEEKEHLILVNNNPIDQQNVYETISSESTEKEVEIPAGNQISGYGSTEKFTINLTTTIYEIVDESNDQCLNSSTSQFSLSHENAVDSSLAQSVSVDDGFIVNDTQEASISHSRKRSQWYKREPIYGKGDTQYMLFKHDSNEPIDNEDDQSNEKCTISEESKEAQTSDDEEAFDFDSGENVESILPGIIRSHFETETYDNEVINQRISVLYDISEESSSISERSNNEEKLSSDISLTDSTSTKSSAGNVNHSTPFEDKLEEKELQIKIETLQIDDLKEVEHFVQEPNHENEERRINLSNTKLVSETNNDDASINEFDSIFDYDDKQDEENEHLDKSYEESTSEFLPARGNLTETSTFQLEVQSGDIESSTEKYSSGSPETIWNDQNDLLASLNETATNVFEEGYKETEEMTVINESIEIPVDCLSSESSGQYGFQLLNPLSRNNSTSDVILDSPSEYTSESEK